MTPNQTLDVVPEVVGGWGSWLYTWFWASPSVSSRLLTALPGLGDLGEGPSGCKPHRVFLFCAQGAPVLHAPCCQELPPREQRGRWGLLFCAGPAPMRLNGRLGTAQGP